MKNNKPDKKETRKPAVHYLSMHTSSLPCCVFLVYICLVPFKIHFWRKVSQTRNDPCLHFF